jgi:glutamate formiminotransferase
VLVECVANVSEGRDLGVLAALDAAAGYLLRDRHSDPDHHRSVFTLVGPADEVVDAARALAIAVVQRHDVGVHAGAHPRLGVLDVVPFVPYEPGQAAPQDLGTVTGLRDDFARWLAETCGVPAFLYGPLAVGAPRTLPEVRREAFRNLEPDFGPHRPHPRAGATAVGARPVLVAYNVWVSTAEVARQVATQIRGAAVRALGLDLGDRAQVSCNLIDPDRFGPERLYDEVAALVEAGGGATLGAELVGLVPSAVLERIPPPRWPELALSASQTVEARL